MRRCVPAFALSFVLPAAALGQLVYPFHQQRYIDLMVADYWNSPVEQSDAAAGFDTWQSDLCLDQPDVQRSASADQYSTIGTSILDVFGDAEIHVTPFGYSSQDFYACSATNSYYVKFALSEAATLDLIGHMAVEADVPANAYEWSMSLRVWVQVNEIAGDVVYEDVVLIPVDFFTWTEGETSLVVEAPVAGAAELSAGVYGLTVSATLEGAARQEAQPVSGQAAYVVSAEFVPLPAENPTQADLDGDGDVDLADFARFQRAMTGPL
jgi:hypothetical protein